MLNHFERICANPGRADRQVAGKTPPLRIDQQIVKLRVIAHALVARDGIGQARLS